MNKIKIVFLDRSTFQNPRETFNDSDLKAFGDWCEYSETETDEELQSRTQGADVIITIKNKLTAKELDLMPSVRLICKAGSGVDNIDLAAARARKITVCNLPSYGTEMVAQWTWSLILAWASQLIPYDKAIRKAGNWKDLNFAYPTVELAGKTLGIIGFGRVGRQVAAWARAFGMRILVFSHTAKHPDFDFVDLDTLARSSDFITLHCPLNDRTRGLIGDKFLAKMKPTAYLVNTARAPIVDESALLACLKKRQIAGAAFDVFWNEPLPPSHELAQLENVILTPHMAWSAPDTRQRVLDQLVQVITAYYEGHPIHVVS